MRYGYFLKYNEQLEPEAANQLVLKTIDDTGKRMLMAGKLFKFKEMRMGYHNEDYLNNMISVAVIGDVFKIPRIVKRLYQ